MRKLSGMRSRCDVLRTEYNTDDPLNPKEIATLYTVFEYYKGGGRTDSLHYLLIIRQKSRIVFKEELHSCFEDALVRYCREVRKRAEEWHPIGMVIHSLHEKEAER